MERYHQSESLTDGINGCAGSRVVYVRWCGFSLAIALGVAAFAGLGFPLFAKNLFSANSANRLQVTGVQIPIYLKCATNGLEITSDVVAVVGFESIKKDRQRIGFLRIGVLPLIVLDQLNLQIVDPTRLGEALARTNQKLQEYVKSGTALEGREFKLQSPSGNAVLIANVVRFKGDTWRLEDGAITTSKSNCSFHSAVLQMSGANAGELTYNTGHETVRINLSSAAGQQSPKL